VIELPSRASGHSGKVRGWPIISSHNYVTVTLRKF